ncbi:3'-5' exonuclease [Sphingopyxis sp. EG6]|uniref:3'-5' exonuclease n=1 Tax=Sphingopyxis sp. EG6 TaxID=1874061 RepID=UPI000DC62CE3|nr:3'-5' exonuclease [Sphingopyxis sp. EG6]BBB08673.1 exonuclease RNase T and DNA polymerase III [Sphingopyxis sp. EG6]
MQDEVPDPGALCVPNGDDDVRLLRRLDVREGETGVGGRVDTFIGVAVDCETTGIGDEDAIIELALRRFRVDPAGVIVKIDRPYSWLEDPGCELPEDIVRLTGITNADLAGKSIDDGVALRLLKSATFVCAHNASFDRRHVERRLPEAAGLAWCCSCNDIDWRANGFDGRSLGWLLAQSGYFHGAHRAVDDVDAVIQILRQNMPDGTTALAQMLTTARAPSWRFRAVGASFEVKDLLRLRGYRWDAASNPKCWWREVPDARRAEEEWWLASHVYSMEANPRALGPIIERLTWRERYAPTAPSNRPP